MSESSQQFYSVAQLREFERAAIAGGIAGYRLMQRAAAASLRVLRARWPQLTVIDLVAGPGSNGGDGYELATQAQAAGFTVRLWAVGLPTRGDALQARANWLAQGGAAPEFTHECLRGASCVVDALFGIGISRPLDGRAIEVVRAIQQARESGAKVLALDLPSGLDADRGSVQGSAVAADITVTFIADKLGLHTSAGPDCCGEIICESLEVPVTERGLAQRLNTASLRAALSPRARTAHKGHNGHVLVVGGDDGMGGAALLAARAALRAGAGLVSVATHPLHAAVLLAAQPELMSRGVQDAEALRDMMRQASVVALGPGLGQRPWGQALWTQALATHLPMVVDADGLNWLAQNPESRVNWVLTPHPGEAGRLLGVSTAQIQQDRLAAVRELQARYGGVVVLKGAGSLVQGARLSICTAGNPGMAVGGMGDVLCGVIAGLLAQGLPVEEAAGLGVQIHACAGDAAAMQGERGLLPSDVIAALREQVNP